MICYCWLSTYEIDQIYVSFVDNFLNIRSLETAVFLCSYRHCKPTNYNNTYGKNLYRSVEKLSPNHKR